MKKPEELFLPDANTKAFIKEVSTLFGVKSNIVQELFSYMLFSWILQLSQEPEKLQTITIPYIGNLGIRFKNDFIDKETGEFSTEIETFLALNQNFKKLISDLNDKDISGLTSFLKNNYINKLIDDTLTN